MRLVAKIMPKKEMMKEMEEKYPDFKIFYFEAIQAIFGLANELEKTMDHYFGHRCERFSRARFLILMILTHAEGERLPPNEIAKKLNVTRGNMTGLIDSLEKDGYVKKYQDDADRRQVWIELQPAGKKLLEKIFPDYFKRIHSFISILKRDEIFGLTKTLDKLTQSVSENFVGEGFSKCEKVKKTTS